MLELLLDAVIDTAKTLPFLFGAYLLIEFLEHRASEKLTGALQRPVSYTHLDVYKRQLQ